MTGDSKRDDTPLSGIRLELDDAVPDDLRARLEAAGAEIMTPGNGTYRLIHRERREDEVYLAGVRTFHRWLEEALTERADSESLAVISFDVDRMKHLAATYGQEVMETILTALKKRFLDRAGEMQAVDGSLHLRLAVLAHDEIAILADHLPHAHTAAGIAEEFSAVFAEPFKRDGEKIFLTASAGIAMAPVDGQDAATLLQEVRAAIRRGKKEPQTNVTFAHPETIPGQQERDALENRLRRVLEEDELTLYYQPQYDSKGHLAGAEALVRWQHGAMGLLSPDAFLEIAEEAGLMRDIGRWILDHALSEMRDFTGRGCELAVNISPSMLRDGRLGDIVGAALQKSGTAPENLVLEVTESILIPNLDTAVDVLSGLRQEGVKVALDDFGTGFSSLAYLKDLPIDHVKIDRKFVSGIAKGSRAETLLATIVKMAKALDLLIIAEGVETEEELTVLKSMKIDCFQGFYFSRALTADDLFSLSRD